MQNHEYNKELTLTFLYINVTVTLVKQLLKVYPNFLPATLDLRTVGKVDSIYNDVPIHKLFTGVASRQTLIWKYIYLW